MYLLQFFPGPYNKPRNIWDSLSCENHSDCRDFIEEYQPVLPVNDIYQRPNSDCCSGVDPMLEDGGPKACLENPENFQSRFITDGSLFVTNLKWDTQSSELLEVFRDRGFQPESASIAKSFPSEKLPLRVPLGWGTVYVENVLALSLLYFF